jgi:hypothetical protein
MTRSPASVAPSPHKITETLPRELHVPFRRSLRSLLERMEHVDRFIELRDVEDTMRDCCMDANLPNPETDRGHRFPIVWLKPTLNPQELESCDLPYVGWETTQIVSGRSEPDHGLLSHALLYKYRHMASTRQPLLVGRQ